MALPRILLVDDNDTVRTTLAQVLELNQFEVVTATSVTDALRQIGKGNFDVLLTDLHMPAAGDGMTVVSAMKHSNPLAVTMGFSGYPEMQAALSAILLQAEEGTRATETACVYLLVLHTAGEDNGPVA